VSDEDLRGSRVERSTADAYGAIDHFIKDNPHGVVPVDVFRKAALRGLRDEYGIIVDADRMVHVTLPPPLRNIPKTNESGEPALSIIPRLYTLDLTPKGVQNADDVKKLMENRRRPVQAFGTTDLPTNLNDFLTIASKEELEWLMKLLDQLDVAES
jgi:hypothetical protein